MQPLQFAMCGDLFNSLGLSELSLKFKSQLHACMGLNISQQVSGWKAIEGALSRHSTSRDSNQKVSDI